MEEPELLNEITPPQKTASNKPSLLINISFLIIGILIGGFSSFLIFNQSFNFNITENTSLSKNSLYTFGIDISHYQGKINWSEVRSSHHPIEFVFIRSSMGQNGTDDEFKNNWKNAKKYNFLRGAYHYYRPNENSTLQFQNFSKKVKLIKGDFPPILDIERPSKFGDENLRKGVLNWLKLAEKYYGIKPVIYTGRKFYTDHLKGYVKGYPLWIASYSGKSKLRGLDWSFHQFTEQVRVKGIRNSVDGNDFKGEYSELVQMCLK